MKLSFANATLSSALKQRSLALWACLVLSLSNLVLVVMLMDTEEHWVLMPQYDEGHRLELTRSRYSDAYFVDWATGILNTLLCANPDSIEWKISQILAISRANYGQLKEQLHSEAQKIRQDQVSTAFYPSAYKVSQAQQTVEVTGAHSAYFGKDSIPVITQKTFRLTWAVRGHGVILLENFEEVENDHKS